MSVTDLPPAQRLVLAAVGLLFVLWFAGMGYRNLVDPDEGRYAEIPREMVASGDWVTPRLDGFKYFEKPPLQYWTTAIAFSVLGTSNMTARLWLTLIGFVGVLWTGYVSARLFGRRAGIYALVMTASALLYCGAGHYLTLDMSVTVFLAIGVGSLAIAQSQRNDSHSLMAWMLVGWIALAGAVLSKGLIGVVLPGAAVLIYSVWQKDWALWRHLHLIKGTALFLALTAPWFVIVSLRNPEFFNFFFIHEHFARYATHADHHEAPVFYFLLVFLLGLVPWTLVSVRSIVRPDFTFRPLPGGEFEATRFMWVFAVFVLVFFSLSESKLPAYILPALPIVIVLASKRLAETFTVATDGWVALAVGVVLLATGAMARRLASETIPAELFAAYQPWIIGSGVAMMLAGLALLTIRHRPMVAMLAAGVCATTSCQLVLWGYDSLTPSRSGREIASRVIALPDSAKAPIYLVGLHAPSLPFYLGRLVTMVDYEGELQMGMDSEPDKGLTLEQFARQWRSEHAAFAVVSNSRLATLIDSMKLPMSVVHRGPRATLVVR